MCESPRRRRMRQARPTRPTRWFAGLVLLLSTLAGAVAVAAEAAPSEHCNPEIVFETTNGSLTIELLPNAAPVAVERLLRLADGPLYHPDLHAPRPIGYYDGLEFSRTNPDVEIQLSPRRPAGHLRLEHELDAEALGLDAKRITADEAMDVLQTQVLAEHARVKGSDAIPPALTALVDEYFDTFEADHLVGQSWKTIYEAQGVEYRSGLASEIPSRGTVSLIPLSATEASPAFSIQLADIPERIGRWTVVGRVVEGLDIAEAISRAPLVPGRFGHKHFRPLTPVSITDVVVTREPDCSVRP